MLTQNKIASARLLARTIANAPFVPERYWLTQALGSAMWTDQYRFALPRLPGGGYLKVDMRDWPQRQMYLHLYEKQESALVRRLLRSGDVFVDAGANIGYYTVLAAPIVGPSGRVYAFEPVPGLYDALVENISRNEYSNVVATQAALSNGPLFATLYLGTPGENDGSASIAASPSRKQALSVPAITLDEYLRGQGVTHVDLMKLDIEGSEVQAIEGAHTLLSRPDAPALIFEVSPFHLDLLALPRDATEKAVKSYGYDLQVVASSPADSGPAPYTVLATKH